MAIPTPSTLGASCNLEIHLLGLVGPVVCPVVNEGLCHLLDQGLQRLDMSFQSSESGFHVQRLLCCFPSHGVMASGLEKSREPCAKMRFNTMALFAAASYRTLRAPCLPTIWRAMTTIAMLR